MADPKRVSFHIGVRTYDPVAYPTARRLISSKDDAKEMYNLAIDFGYTDLDLQSHGQWNGVAQAPPNVKIDTAATYETVADLFKKAADVAVDKGDRCFITLSCHGVQVPDTDTPPEDKELLDEAVCLFDFMMTDDVLTGLLRGFRADVDVILVLDCCNAGPSNPEGGPLESAVALGKTAPEFTVSLATSSSERRTDSDEFGIQKSTESPDGPPPIAVELQEKFKGTKHLKPHANVAVFAACEDGQKTFTGKELGDLSVYTKKFVKAAGDGSMTVAALSKAIKEAPPDITDCTPQFRTTGDAILDVILKP